VVGGVRLGGHAGDGGREVGRGRRRQRMAGDVARGHRLRLRQRPAHRGAVRPQVGSRRKGQCALESVRQSSTEADGSVLDRIGHQGVESNSCGLAGCLSRGDAYSQAVSTDNLQGDEWEEKWGEHYAASGEANKYADKWGKDGPNVWHERWGEDYDGRGGCTKYTDKVCAYMENCCKASSSQQTCQVTKA
jgi:hypothetical protein